MVISHKFKLGDWAKCTEEVSPTMACRGGTLQSYTGNLYTKHLTNWEIQNA